MPGLVDCHIHASQVKNAGTGYEKTFTEWLFQDTLPTEQVFDMNLTYARSAASLTVVCNFVLQVR